MARKRNSPAEAEASAQSQSITAGPGATIHDVTQIFVSGPGKLAETALDLFAGRGLSTSAAEASIKLGRELKRQWIDGKLARSLTEGRSAELAFRLLPPRTDLADNAITESAEDSAAPSINSLREILEESGNSLLLLGSAGAGKTTALLLLMREMLEPGAASTQKLPVFLPLRDFAADAEGRHFEAWIERQLFSHYRIGGDAARALLTEKRLLLLLDALDEAENPEKCVAAIAGFLERHDADCVVSCRSQVAGSAGATSLPLRTTAALVPLDDKSIRAYVKALGPAYRPLLRQLGEGATLLALCRLPLMLHLAVSGFDATASPDSATLDEDSLITRYFATGLKLPSAYGAKVTDYLGNLIVLAGPGGDYNYIRVDFTGDGWIGERWPSGVELRVPTREMDINEEIVKSGKRWSQHFDRDLAYRSASYGMTGLGRRLPSIIRIPWFSILRLVESARYRIGEWRAKKDQASGRVPFSIRLSLRLVEIIASLAAVVIASILVALLIGEARRITSFNGFELLSEWHFMAPLVTFLLWWAVFSKWGRGWRLGSSVGTIAAGSFVVVAFLALLIGGLNWIVWRAQWLIPVLLIAISTFLARANWKETADTIARMRQFYQRPGEVEETPRAWVFHSDSLGTTVIQKPSFRRPRFWVEAAGAMVLPAIALGVIRLFGGEANLLTSLTGYGLVAAWLWVNIVASVFTVSLVYFLFTRCCGVFPWRMRQFVNALAREGVLERDGKNLRMMHARIHEFLRRRARYKRLDGL